MRTRRVLLALGIAAVSFAAATGGFFWFQHAIRVREQRATGRLLADRALLVVHWKGLESHETFGKFIQSVSEQLAFEPHAIRFISPDPSIGGEQPKDDFERYLLARFAGDALGERGVPRRAPFAERGPEDGAEYRYYQPIYADRGCLRICHQPDVGQATAAPSPFGRAAAGDRKWNDGELMAVVEIAIPAHSSR